MKNLKKPFITSKKEKIRRTTRNFFLKKILYVSCFILFLSPYYANGQGQNATYDPSVFIDININSGDPAFPYPQFKEYKVGKTLAKYNAEGVTHADMEKTGREAYEIMSHRCRYSGVSQDGVKYITFNSEDVPASVFAPHCSEGDGYMLLMSAIFADQPTFNGLWMWIHDYKIPHAIRYQDGETLFEDYSWSPGLPTCFTTDKKLDSEKTGPHGVYSDASSATDGDDDIALALLIAYKQWGEPMMQNGKPVKDANGKQISYKEILDDFLKAYADTFMVRDGSFEAGHSSGDIGIDGYVIGGNKGGDITQWRATQTDYPGITPYNMMCSNSFDHTDYVAPAYYNEFAKYLEEEGEGTGKTRPWLINQYKRAEASSDWLIGQCYDQGYIASFGGATSISLNGDQVGFSSFSEGEDFRFAMRTILNYMWHGNPETTWDPVKHQPVAGGNTFEYDMAMRHAEFLKEPWSGYGNKAPGDLHGQCVQMGAAADPGQPYWSGVCNIMQSYFGDKNPMGSGASPAPYTLGAMSTSAVCSGDLDLIADMYRQSEITWDATNKACTWDSEERYIGSTPEYFHGFFRCWGLLAHSGNLHAPQNMKREANVKVYMSVDKTYAYVDDKIEYTVQFRNYGSGDASDVKIETSLDPNYKVVSITRGNGSISGDKIIWNVGNIPGFKTGGLDATIDSVSFVVVVKDTLNPRICLTSTVSGSNFEEWTSNEYPNHATYTMERNCVDIVPDRTLQLKKKASRKVLNPNDAVTFTLEFENKSLGEASWLNGGRDNVRLSYANYVTGTEMFQGYRFWHDAYEAYINPGNYRVSYFMYDAAAMGLYSADNPTGWDFTLNNANDCYKYLLTDTPDTISFHYQRVPYGEDEHGKWNQRLMVQFADFTMAPSSYTFNKIAERPESPTATPGANNFYSLHKGIGGPAFIRTQLRSNPHLAMEGKVKDDWSYEKLETKERPMDMQSSALYLLTPCYADVNNLGYEVNIHGRNVCYTGDIDMTTYDRMLVEEFDGYTWRRILGRAPLPGRECMNVEIVDTIPYELEFHHWVDSTALKNDKGEKIQATYTPAPDGSKAYSGIVKWTVPSMLVGEKDKLVYVCVARDMGCPDIEDITYSNIAWISSDTDSPDSSRVDLMTTCSEIPPVGDEQESLFKSADKSAAQQGEKVEYKVKYINNTGTHVEADCKSTTGWKALGNSTLPAIDGGNILLNTENSHLFAPEYSYGNNGDVYFQLDRCTDAITNTWIVLRWTSGTPGEANFKGAAVKVTPHASLDNTFKCEVYDNGTCIAKEGDGDDLIIYPGDGKNPEFKFTFIDDHLYMYINNADDEWVDVMKDWKGLSANGPGYFGMYVKGKTNAAPHLTKFITDLDYAFNVTLYDQLPEELGNVSDISDNGALIESKNLISWPTVATTVETAIAPNDSVVRTFSAEVIACVDKYITNMGIGTVYGLDSLKILNTIECGTNCNLTEANATISAESICEGDSAIIKVETKDKSSYLYQFYKDGEKIGTQSKIDSLIVKESGEYKVIVSSPTDATCTIESNSVSLLVNTNPTAIDYSVGVICVNSSLSTNETYNDAVKANNDAKNLGYTMQWFNDKNLELSEMPNPSKDSIAGSFDFYYLLTTDKGCVSDTAHLTYTISDTIKLSLKDITICEGQTGTLDANVEAKSYLWNDLNTTKTQTMTTDKAGIYTLTIENEDGCQSIATAEIKVQEKLFVDLGNDTIICNTNLPYVLDASANYETYKWNDDSEQQTFEVNETGTYTVKVTQGTCEGEGSVSIIVSKVEAPIVDHSIAYVVADTNANGLFDKTLTIKDPTAIIATNTLVWYDANKTQLTAEPIPNVPMNGGNSTENYYVSAKNSDGCESELVLVEVTISGAPTPIVSNVTYCLNDPLVVPLEATATQGEDANESWSIQWYDATGTKINTPTPDVTSVGEITYYVSQISNISGAESGKVPVKITIYGVAKPDVSSNRLQYCEGETYEKVVALSQSNTTEYLMSDETPTYIWSIDGIEVNDPTITTQKESITYSVKETYTIDELTNHVCESEPAEFTIKTTFVPSVTGDLTVNYVMKDGEDGTFPPLDTKNPNVAKATEGFDLVWFDENKQISSSVPSPQKNSTWEEGKEQKITYFVAQSDGICTSDTIPVEITISDSPMPRTAPIEYCQNATAEPLKAIINDDTEDASNFELVWFDLTTGDELTTAPTPKTDVVGEFTYYVAQKQKTTQALSAKSPLKVTIHKLPELVSEVVPAQCGGSVILSNYMKEKNGMAIIQNFYTIDPTNSEPTSPSEEIVSVSGKYYSDGYYTLTNGDKCQSEKISVDIYIDNLSDLNIIGDSISCPNDTKLLTATAVSTEPGIITYTWEDGTSSEEGKYTTPTLSGAFGTQYTFTVKASAGACVETLSNSHTITINKGVLTGEISVNNVVGKTYKTCGNEELTISTTHTGTNYVWSTSDGRQLGSSQTISDNPTESTTYILNLTNVCATSDTIIVEVHPLNAVIDWSDLNKTICTGESFSVNANTNFDATMQGAYFKWYKDDVEISAYEGKTNWSVTMATEENAGVYSYKVSNGICSLPEAENSGELKVITPATYTQTDGLISCSGDSIEMSVTINENDATLIWNDDATAGPTRSVSPTETTSYPFTITKESVCTTTGSIIVEVKEKPIVELEDITICEGNETELKAKVEGDDLNRYVWTDEKGNEIGNTNTLIIKPEFSSEYRLTVGSDACGEVSAKATVTVNELPKLSIDSLGMQEIEIKIENETSSSYMYKIDNKEWQNNSVFEKIKYTLHTAYAKDEFGCIGSLMFERIAPEYQIPTIFSPDNNGVNDTWDVTTLMEIYPNSTVTIYDRYGKKLVELKGENSDWDGTYNGHQMPSTDYWYTVDIPEIDKTYNGHFTLLRSK